MTSHEGGSDDGRLTAQRDTVNARYGPENQIESINDQVRIINNRGQSPTSCTDSMMES
jgi:hypothetical protein